MAEETKKTETVNKPITKIGKYPIKCTFRTAEIYSEQFGLDFYQSINDQFGLYGGGVTLDVMPYIRAFWAMAATSNEDLRGQDGWDKFLDNDMNVFFGVQDKIFEAVVQSQDYNPKKK
ncbi:MAG: hypothetical protein RR533_03520 [Carnobacterium sp.]